MYRHFRPLFAIPMCTGIALLAVCSLAGTSPVSATSRAHRINLKALLHDPMSTAYRSPFGAVPAGTPVTLRLRTAHGGASAVTLQTVTIDASNRTKNAGSLKLRIASRGKTYDTWTTTFTPKKVSDYGYRFLVQLGTARATYATPRFTYTGSQNCTFTALRTTSYFELTSYDPSFTVPSWAKDMVIYQIFPDRFFNGDPANDSTVIDPVYGHTHPTIETDASSDPKGEFDFFGGDLQGVIDKLPYLKSLGVNTLYLNPVFLAPSNHKYDTTDYFQIDPHFGTVQTFQSLLEAAHTAGMHVIMDGVFNHTGSDSVYFNRYGRFPTPGAYQSKSSTYFPWYDFQLWPMAYSDFCGHETLPQLAENNAVKDFIFRQPDSVAQHWLAAGADGWRLDAAQLKSHQWWQQFRQSIKARFPDAILIAEDTADPRPATPFLLGNELDGVMNYRFRDTILSFFPPGGSSLTVHGLYRSLMSTVADYPLPALYSSMNVVGTHDTDRILSALGGNTTLLKEVATLQMTWLGAPAIYYGDEAGLQGKGSDDLRRRFFPWSHQDTDLEAYYTKIIAIRRANPALRDGTISPLVLDDTHGVFSFLRKDALQSVAVALNTGSTSASVTLKISGLAGGARLTDAISGAIYTSTPGKVTLTLPATSSAILIPAP